MVCQKSLRHFWMPYLEATLGGMIFLVALSSYDQFLEEEPTENRMMDALQLFEGICKIEKVNHLPILLFLNKLDLFEEKIKVSSVKSHFNNFPAHQDEKNLKAGKNFFKSLFLEKNSNKERRIYSHFTSATDTKLMKVIFIAVRDIIYKLNLSNSGLM
ncbi:guanine nucleotide-binding protein subunit alpha [Clydaea vesicula]|uniref:Guanine nucleotide-binding protein subunit alpha n=1 Tax=Clydaea vesicula TaxID=447962 RepID=A0AAD5XWS3_9FUNG|nr:guanine nucleotide-binding protein subunit alpha [Clydaea vesicula]